MADTTTTPNMGLTLPTASQRPGPQYASDINQALTDLDAHDHSAGNGVKVTPNGLDLSSDLSLQGNNLTNAQSVRLAGQITNLSGSNDVLSLYTTGGDLWYNNAAGAPVKITLGGGLNTGALVTNVWGTKPINANLTVLGSDSYTNINVSNSSPLTINLPAANAVAGGRYYVIQDVGGSSQSFPISLTPSGSNTINGASGSKSLSSAYSTWFVRSDGISAWQLTYTGIPGLTATALTYGSAVFNSSGVTVGSVTLTSSALTVGSSVLSGSGLTASTLTVSGAQTGYSAHYTNSVVIDGNLTVTGSVNINASNLAISGIDSGTITNCSITGGTMDSTSVTNSSWTGGFIGTASIDSSAITNGSVSGAVITGSTITGGSVGAANGLATLDSSSKLSASERTGWIVAIYQTNLAFAQSMSGSAFQTITSLNMTGISVQAGDRLMIDAIFVFQANAGASIEGKIIISDNGFSVDPNQYVFGTAASKTIGFDLLMLPRSFAYTVLNTGTLSIQCYASSPSGNPYYALGQTTVGGSNPTFASSIRLMQVRL